MEKFIKKAFHNTYYSNPTGLAQLLNAVDSSRKLHKVADSYVAQTKEFIINIFESVVRMDESRRHWLTGYNGLSDFHHAYKTAVQQSLLDAHFPDTSILSVLDHYARRAPGFAAVFPIIESPISIRPLEYAHTAYALEVMMPDGTKFPLIKNHGL